MSLTEISRGFGFVCLAFALSAGMAQADFRGGGALFAFTSACGGAGWPVGGSVPVRVRHAPSELYGQPSQVTIALPTQTQHFSVWSSFAPTTRNYNALGRQILTNFRLYPQSARLRPIQRRITERINPAQPETVANAREMFLRLRIERFNDVPGCSVTLAAVLRRF